MFVHSCACVRVSEMGCALLEWLSVFACVIIVPPSLSPSFLIAVVLLLVVTNYYSSLCLTFLLAHLPVMFVFLQAKRQHVDLRLQARESPIVCMYVPTM